MKYTISTAFLTVALVAIGLGWYVDRHTFRDSLNSPGKFVDIGFSMGKAAESTLIYAMLDNDNDNDNDNVTGDPDRFAHIRERELIVNVLSMAAVHRTVTMMEKEDSDDSIPEWWADQSLDFGARSIRLLDVGAVQEFQSVLENHGWDLEFVNVYKSDDGSLASDLVAFIELALINNVEHDRVYGE